MDKTLFVKLCSRRWSLTALALIASGVQARVSPVAHAAGCGRTAMTASFERLLELGLMVRSPGHGHPLRPEFMLSAEGREIAKWALQLETLLDDDVDRRRVRRAWTLPILFELNEPRRFNELRKALKPITDRALTLALTDCVDAGWIERIVDAETSPPAVSYRAIGKGADISGLLEAFPNRP